VHSSAPFGTPIGWLTGKFADLFYGDPRRLAAVVTMLVTAAAGIALFTLVAAAVAGVRRLADRGSPRVWQAVTMVVIAAVSVGAAWHYLPRHKFLFGDKYDSVIVGEKDLEAWAYLATLPGARDTLIGDANTDGTAWMYAVAGLHPLWTHYD